MGAEFLMWKYRPALLVTVLFFVVFKMHLTSTDNSVAPVGKLYTRGNHWAVGHLMGKKSTGSVASKRISYQPLQSPEEDEQLDSYSQPSSLVRGLIRVLTGQESRTEVIPHREWLWTGRESGRKDEKDRTHDRGN
ncbi:hypothetical protein ANANG_G00263280 [Anguilla anguilla]|uniref:Gastrin-releasing peptide n=1 Tax=Anguilla anguilla TaxID=7936 RepID=A0A9D3LT09_ANGAN|nr:hypothetical protein ANANG_G00263280 [Anguilla anguilla]